MQEQFVTETMPIPPFWEGKPRILFIGTFPPARHRWDYPFFFPNRQNRLWNTLARIAHGDEKYQLPVTENEAQEVEMRKQILHKLDAAMVNIIHQCIRKNGSALDNDLVVLQLEDIVGQILRNIPTIEAIFITSKSGQNSCLNLLKKHLLDHRIRLTLQQKSATKRDKQFQAPDLYSFMLDQREIKVYSLFSPSPTSLRAGITEAALYQQYQIIRSF